MEPKPLRIALVGSPRTGKDEVGKILVKNHGFSRVAYGDYVKRDLDPLIREHFGFSAFTEVDEEKNKIRGVLLHWGTDNKDSITRRLYANLPPRAVNTRAIRFNEVKEWHDRGGLVVEVFRPGFTGCGPAEEEAEVKAVADAGLIDHTICNMGSVIDLEDHVLVTLRSLEACR